MQRDHDEVMLRMVRRVKLMMGMLGVTLAMLGAIFVSASPASAATINLNGDGAGIQSVTMYPHNVWWLNTPTEYSVTPQPGAAPDVADQTLSTARTIRNRWEITGTQQVSYTVWRQASRRVLGGYNTSWRQAWGWKQVPRRVIYAWYPQSRWRWTLARRWGVIGWKYEFIQTGWRVPPGSVAIWGRKGGTEFRVPISGWIYRWYKQWYTVWVPLYVTRYYPKWSFLYWYPVYTPFYVQQWYSYQVTEWQTVNVWGWVATTVTTTVAARNIHILSESYAGSDAEVRNTATGQTIPQSYCPASARPVLDPMLPNGWQNPEFPNYSGDPLEYANFFDSQGICNVNPNNMPTNTYAQWAYAKQSAQLILQPYWTARVSYDQVTTVNGVVTSSVPVTQTVAISGTPYAAPAMAIKYIIAVVCAVQNGQTYCPAPAVGG